MAHLSPSDSLNLQVVLGRASGTGLLGLPLPASNPHLMSKLGQEGAGPESSQLITGGAVSTLCKWGLDRGRESPNSELLLPERELQQHKPGMEKGKEN